MYKTATKLRVTDSATIAISCPNPATEILAEPLEFTVMVKKLYSFWFRCSHLVQQETERLQTVFQSEACWSDWGLLLSVGSVLVRRSYNFLVKKSNFLFKPDIVVVFVTRVNWIWNKNFLIFVTLKSNRYLLCRECSPGLLYGWSLLEENYNWMNCNFGTTFNSIRF